MAKNNIRSFRYSDEVANILNGFEGRTMNEKFENLVKFCFRAVPEKQRQLDSIDRQIQSKREQFSALCSQFSCISSMVYRLQSIEKLINNLEL